MEPYEMVGKFPSFNDFNEQNQRIKANQLSMMMQGNQVDNLPLQNQMLQYQVSGAGLANLQAQRKAQIMQLFADRLGGQGAPQGAPGVASAALGSGAAQGSVGPTVANGNRLSAMQGGQQAPGGGLLGIDPDTMFLGEMAGMMPEGAAKLWTENRFGRPMQPGYRQNMDGSATYFGDPTKGVTMDAQGKVVEMPNAGATLAGMAGRTKAAETAGVASQTMAPETRLGADGRPVNQTVGQLLAGTGAPDPFNSSAPMGAPAAPTMPGAISQLSPAQQQAAAADMAQRGQDLSTMKVNGAPAFGDMQSQLDAAKQGGPTAIQRFVQSVAPSLKGDPKLMAGLAYDLHTPVGTPIHAMGAASGASAAPSATPSASPFMGPAEAAAQKLAAEQGIHAETDPVIALRKSLVTESHTSNQKFMDDLGSVVNNEAEIVSRNNRLQPLLAQLPKIGGFGQDARTNFANNLKQAGLPDSLTSKIAGGDPEAAKVVDNQLSAAAIQTMLDTLNKEGKPNRVMYQALHEQQEGLAAGKPVLQKIMALQNQLYQQHLEQQKSATDLMAAPDYNPVRFQSQFASAKNKQIQSPPPAVGATTAGPANVASDADYAALPKGAEFIAPDGSHRRKP